MSKKKKRQPVTAEQAIAVLNKFKRNVRRRALPGIEDDNYPAWVASVVDIEIEMYRRRL